MGALAGFPSWRGRLGSLVLVLCTVVIPAGAFLGARPGPAGKPQALGEHIWRPTVKVPSETAVAAQPGYSSQQQKQQQGGGRRGPDLRELNKSMQYWGKRRDFRRVMELLQQLEREGLEPNIYTFNALMHACVLCRTSDDVRRQLWDRMVVGAGLRPNAITYNTLIKRFFGSRSSAASEQALLVLSEMERERVAPDVMTFNELINICVETGEMHKATDLVRDMEARGLRPDVLTYTTLIKGYGLKGNLTSAFDTLDRMRAQNVPLTTYSCNVLADACIRCGQPLKALKLFRDFEASGLGGGVRMLDLKSYNIMMKAQREMGRLDAAWETLEELRHKGFEPDVVSFNTLVDACCKGQQPDRAKALIHEMQDRGIPVTHHTLHPLLAEEVAVRVPTAAQAVELGRSLLAEYCFTPNNATICTLMEAMLDLDRPRDAIDIFLDAYVRDGSSAPASEPAYNTLLKAYRQVVVGADPEDDLAPVTLAVYRAARPPTVSTVTSVEEVLRAALPLPAYMRSMGLSEETSPSSVTFNILMDMAAELGDLEALQAVEAERAAFGGLGLDHYLIHSQMKCHAVRQDLAGVTEVKERMDRLRVPPNERTFSVLVLSLLRCGETAKAELLLRNALARSLYIHDSLFMAFLHHYASAGQLEQVDATFQAYQDKVRRRNVSVWNSYMGALAVMGHVERCEDAFEQMVQEGFRPTSRTYYHLIKASCVAKDLTNALSWLGTMRSRGHGGGADVKAYNWVIHACLDLDDTHALVGVLQAMEADGIKPNRVTARAKDRILRALASRIKHVGDDMLTRLGRTMAANTGKKKSGGGAAEGEQ